MRPLLFLAMLFKMKHQVIFIHGGDSFSARKDFLQYLKTRPLRDLPSDPVVVSWRNSLSEDLGQDFEVFMPKMPNRENASYEEWKIWFERYLALIKKEVILIGHSLGGMFLAKYLSENSLSLKVSKLYLLAAPGGEFLGEEKYGDCTDFRFLAGTTKNIAKNVKVINIWHSEDDFIVPVLELDWYEKLLPEAKIVRFKDKNHFLLSEFPELLNDLKST